MFDPDVFMGLIFTIIMTLIVGGFLVSIPIIRRLGKLTDAWVHSRQEGLSGQKEFAMLMDRMEIFEDRLSDIETIQNRVAQRQEFVEGLMTGERRAQLESAEHD
jgi:hypothetical protein